MPSLSNRGPHSLRSWYELAQPTRNPDALALVDERPYARLTVLRARNLAVVFLGMAAVAAILALGGCFNSKISRSRAAAILKKSEGAGTWKKVACVPWRGTDGYWDYACRVESTRARPFTFEIKVSGSGITDQSGP